MDGSLASMFMDSLSTLPNNNPCMQIPAQGSEELQYKLIYAALELESAKASAKAAGKMQEARLWSLQELLNITRKERDAAVEECRKLKERFLPFSAAASDAPCSFVHSASMASSPSANPSASSSSSSQRQWSLPDPHTSHLAFPTMELQQALQSFSQNNSQAQDLHAIFSVTPQQDCEEEEVSASEKFSLDILELELDEGPVLDLAELHQQGEGFFQPTTVSPPSETQSVRSLSRQSSSNSSSASVQHYQMQSIAESPEVSAPLSNYIPSRRAVSAMVAMPPNQGSSMEVMPINRVAPTVAQNKGSSMDALPNSGVAAIVPTQGSSSEAMSKGINVLPTTACSSEAIGFTNGNAAIIPNRACATEALSKGVTTHTPTTACSSETMANNATTSTMAVPDAKSSPVDAPVHRASPSGNLLSGKHSLHPTSSSSTARVTMLTRTPTPVVVPAPLPIRQVHLPEPPEADPQVMLSSLPERGKLLQAVMQAGPLLQTLLLAGPLPQWRHPPPALSTGDIPKVFIPANNSLLLHHAHGTSFSPAPAQNVSSPMAYYALKSNVCGSNVRVADGDPCSRSRKLRRISPVTAMHGEQGRMAVMKSMQHGDVMAASSSIY